MHILHTVPYTFPKGLAKRTCSTITSFFTWWSFPHSYDLHIEFRDDIARTDRMLVTLMGWRANILRECSCNVNKIPQNNFLIVSNLRKKPYLKKTKKKEARMMFILLCWKNSHTFHVAIGLAGYLQFSSKHPPSIFPLHWVSLHNQLPHFQTCYHFPWRLSAVCCAHHVPCFEHH